MGVNYLLSVMPPSQGRGWSIVRVSTTSQTLSYSQFRTVNMNISGLSISGASTHNRRGGGAGGKTAEPALRSVSDARNAGPGYAAEANRHISNAAEAQRAKGAGAVDMSRFVLSGDGDHDRNKFSFRRDHEYENVDPETFGVSRAKSWSVLVENNFRIQQCGWRDVYEYRKVHGEPEVWRSNGCISKVYTKKTGYITYWQEARECPNAKLHLVKLFKYRTKAEGKRAGRK